MKRILKKNIGIALLVVMTISLAGCAFGFDASAYVKSCLDAYCKGEVDEYAKITNTPSDTVQNYYQQNIETELAYLDSLKISPEQRDEYKQLFMDIYKSFQYEVGEATKNDDGSYTVPVTTNKLIVFGTLNKDIQDYMLDYAQKNNTTSVDELYQAALDYMYDVLNDNMAAASYEDDVVIDVVISKTDAGYIISETELRKVLTSMVDIDSMN